MSPTPQFLPLVQKIFGHEIVCFLDPAFSPLQAQPVITYTQFCTAKGESAQLIFWGPYLAANTGSTSCPKRTGPSPKVTDFFLARKVCLAYWPSNHSMNSCGQR